MLEVPGGALKHPPAGVRGPPLRAGSGAPGRGNGAGRESGATGGQPAGGR